MRRGLVAMVVMVVAFAPRVSFANACDDWLQQARQLTGRYVAAAEGYARSYVFAMNVECKGTTELVTVQRATGSLPVCEPGQDVEVSGTPVLSKRLFDAHYEITNPSGVTCRPGTPVAVSAPHPGPAVAPVPVPVVPSPPARAPAAGVQTAALGPTVWVGRYQDSRGAGGVTFALVRGTSTISGTWKLRTGGGGPITGVVDADGRRVQLRMENVAVECPGLFQGTVEITDTLLVGAYQGKDCEGGVTDGRLELRRQ